LFVIDREFEHLAVTIVLGLLLTPFGGLVVYAALKYKAQYSEFKAEKSEITNETSALPKLMIVQTADTADETILFKKGGGQIIGKMGASGGRIILTNKRLFHESLLGKKVTVEVALNDISSYKKAYQVLRLTGGKIMDNSFIIYTKQGFSYKFAVEKRYKLFQFFKQIIPIAEQLPHETEAEAKK
jgi:hypothetical protein